MPKYFLLSFIFIFCLLSGAFAQQATVIAETANLRGTASTEGKIVETLAQNTVVEIVKQNGVWFLVQSADYVGWIHGNTIQITGETDLEQAVRFTTKAPLKKRQTKKVTAQAAAPRPTAAQIYQLGPRGGCFYLSGSGKKVYVDRSLCN